MLMFKKCEHASGTPEVRPALCDKLPCQSVHRPLGELHPPDGVAGLIKRANQAVDATEVLHLVVCFGVPFTVELRRWWRTKLVRTAKEIPKGRANRDPC